MFPFFRSQRREMLGIDIGTSTIKVVELARTNQRPELRTYGEARTREHLATIKEALERTKERELGGESRAGAHGTSRRGAQTFEEGLSDLLRSTFEAANIKTKQAVFSLPVFSSFSTTINFPPTMKEEELRKAVPFEAKSYVPLPLAEVELDWMILPARAGERTSSREVLIVAVPKEIVEKYQRIAHLAGIEAVAYEIETFALARAVAKAEPSAVIVDIGTAATSLTVVAEGFVRLAHSIETAGSEFSRVLAQGLRITVERAEELKKQEGITSRTSSGVRNALLPFVDKLVGEIARLIGVYERKSPLKVQKIILSGGSSRLAGIEEYLSAKVGRPTALGEPLKGMRFPEALEAIVPELNATFAVAVGLALRELT